MSLIINRVVWVASLLIVEQAVAQFTIIRSEFSSQPFWRTHGLGISADGEFVVGSTSGVTTVDNQSRAFKWSRSGGFVDLGPGYAWATNENGDTVVGHGISNAWIHVEGVGRTEIPELDRAISVSREPPLVVGGTRDDRAVIWNAPQGVRSVASVELIGIVGGLSASGSVAAVFPNYDGPSWVVTENAAVPFVPTPLDNSVSYARAVTPDGEYIAGTVRELQYQTRAVRVNNGVMEYLAPQLPGTSERVRCISADGSIVGGSIYINGGGGEQAFIWQGGRSKTIPTLMTETGMLPPSGYRFFSVRGISDDGLTLTGEGEEYFGENRWITRAWVLRLPPPGAGCEADFDEDGDIDSDDTSVFFTLYDSSNVSADLDGDGDVDSDDVLAFFDRFEVGC